jgi:hypothetical protein
MANINEGMAKRDPSDFENILTQMRNHVKDSEEISIELTNIADTLTMEDKLKAIPESDPLIQRQGVIPEICYLLHQLELINGRNRDLLQRLHRMI